LLLFYWNVYQLGFTFDTEINLMLNRVDPQFDSRHPYNQSRYDRIFYKCDDYVPISATILGNKPVMLKSMSLS
jgi:hypothetical protein